MKQKFLTNTMNWMILIPAFLILLLVLLVPYMIYIYNKNKIFEIELSELFSNMESTKTKLNRVYTEVSNLLARYSIHEKNILNAVALGQANPHILLSKYPQLKADNLFMSASDRWNNLYNELQGLLMRYNQKITKYNVSVTHFPDVLVCRSMRFKPRTHAKIV